MKKIYFIAFVLVFSLNTQAQLIYFKTTKEAKEKAEEVVSLIVEGKSEAGFEMLKPHWPISSEQVDELGSTTQSQIPMLEEQFGLLNGYEFVKSESLGTFGYMVEFVIKYDKNALRFYMVFYNGGNGWLVNSLRWDDRWDLLFQTKLKVEN